MKCHIQHFVHSMYSDFNFIRIIHIQVSPEQEAAGKQNTTVRQQMTNIHWDKVADLHIHPKEGHERSVWLLVPLEKSPPILLVLVLMLQHVQGGQWGVHVRQQPGVDHKGRSHHTAKKNELVQVFIPSVQLVQLSPTWTSYPLDSYIHMHTHTCSKIPIHI